MKPPFDYSYSTLAYYDAHASEFCNNTVAVDMAEVYAPFLRELPAGGRILDAGCGSGRDSLSFIQKGYQVVSIDASSEMVAATCRLTGQPAVLMRFDEILFESEFDGIWACASLLHVARQELPATFAGMVMALKPGGVFYLSFKYGNTERIDGGRFFNDMDEDALGQLLAGHPGIETVRAWTTDDVRKDRRQRWLNAIVRRLGGTHVR
jgi:SAM-dependent methyltransferase